MRTKSFDEPENVLFGGRMSVEVRSANGLTLSKLYFVNRPGLSHREKKGNNTNHRRQDHDLSFRLSFVTDSLKVGRGRVFTQQLLPCLDS